MASNDLARPGPGTKTKANASPVSLTPLPSTNPSSAPTALYQRARPPPRSQRLRCIAERPQRRSQPPPPGATPARPGPEQPLPTGRHSSITSIPTRPAHRRHLATARHAINGRKHSYNDRVRRFRPERCPCRRGRPPPSARRLFDIAHRARGKRLASSFSIQPLIPFTSYSPSFDNHVSSRRTVEMPLAHHQGDPIWSPLPRGDQGDECRANHLS